MIAREARRQNRLLAKQMETGQWRVDDRWVVDHPDGDWSFVGQDFMAGAEDEVMRATQLAYGGTAVCRTSRARA